MARSTKESIEPAKGRVSKAEMDRRAKEAEQEKARRGELLQEMAMEVAADDDQPFPAPLPHKKGWWAKKHNSKK